ncbi:MAG: hypothetical protein IKU37_09515 [Candidatus Gastranaerophilales bacterium]|nr:hypothetical protein [Candidatus Gastranaerophilales bacterium]
MKKIKINAEHRALIEIVIRESAKFRGNEELIDLFCDAIYRKSYLIMDAIRDTARLKRHLMMICDGCMDQIIKEKKKYEETRVYRQIEHNTKIQEEIVQLKKNPLTEKEDLEEEFKMQQATKSVVNLKEEIQRSERYDSSDMLIDPLDFCPQKRISEHTIEKLIQIVKIIDSKFPKKRYYEIFTLRYIKKLNQTDIAREMKISQVELSKRFVELIKLTRDNT